MKAVTVQFRIPLVSHRGWLIGSSHHHTMCMIALNRRLLCSIVTSLVVYV